MSAAVRWLFSLGVASFLVAAKAHGRQLRIERELAGYWEVAFGGQNPAWVEMLWRRGMTNTSPAFCYPRGP